MTGVMYSSPIYQHDDFRGVAQHYAQLGPDDALIIPYGWEPTLDYYSRKMNFRARFVNIPLHADAVAIDGRKIGLLVHAGDRRRRQGAAPAAGNVLQISERQRGIEPRPIKSFVFVTKPARNIKAPIGLSRIVRQAAKRNRDLCHPAIGNAARSGGKSRSGQGGCRRESQPG